MASTAITPTTLEATTFARVVLEKRLQVEGPIKGYLYALERTPDGDVLYRVEDHYERRYFWSYRQVCTQDNAGGGNLIATITPATGTAFAPIAGNMTASGNRAAYISLLNADGNNIGFYSNVASVAGASATIAALPITSTTSGAGQGMAGQPVAGPNYIAAVVASAAQTETATLIIYGELIGTSTAPTVSWAASGGTPNAAAAAEDTVSTVIVWPW